VSKFSYIATKTFYNNLKAEEIIGPNPTHRGGVHAWSQHGIAGRALLIDYWDYAQKNDIKYDPYSPFPSPLLSKA
jgi:hypothetical protein